MRVCARLSNPSSLLRAAVLACLAGIVFCVGLAGTALAVSSDGSTLDQIYLQGMSAGTGGNYGYYVKQVGGQAVVQRNDGFVYDPASALKTVLLAYAMRQVANGSDALTNPVTAYVYPNSRNANGDPASPNLCPDPGDEAPANALSPVPILQDVLRGMMQVSNNRYTRAIELRYGRSSLQAFAASLGMASTRLDQIFGCAIDNGVYNTWTLDDGARLYEAIDNGTAVPASAKDQLLSIMITQHYGLSSPIVSSVIRPEADALGIDDVVAPFTTAMVAHWKGGSYNICYPGCSPGFVITRDYAGLMAVPFQAPSGLAPTDFAWGSFITGEQTQCTSSTCDAGNQADSAAFDALAEMFRPVIHAALQSWASLDHLTAEVGTLANGTLRVSANLATQYGGKYPAGQTIEFSVNGAPLCSAATDSTGVAICTGRAHGAVAQYHASFAGTSGLFPAAADGTVRVVTTRLAIRRSGNGRVVSSPAGIACGTRCSSVFPVGGAVKLTAKPAAHWKFARWSGVCKGTKPVCLVKPLRPSSVTAVFARL
jgi:hypothetical protein